MDAQEIVIKLYPECSEPRDWHVQAFVFGEWAVHEVSLDDDGAKDLRFAWQISHIPSGAIAFIARDQLELLEAGRRLSEFSLPSMKVYTGEDGKSKLPLVPSAYARFISSTMYDLKIWAVQSRGLVKPADAWRRYKSYLKRKARIEQEQQP